VRGHIPHPLPGDLFSVGKYNESGRDFHGTIAILRLQLPHAKSLALLPNCFDSPALVKLNEAETAVTIMAYPGFFLKKTLLRRDLPATPEADGMWAATRDVISPVTKLVYMMLFCHNQKLENNK